MGDVASLGSGFDNLLSPRPGRGVRYQSNAECGMDERFKVQGLFHCGMRSSECGMESKDVREYEGTNGLLQCGVRNSECGIHVKCGTPRGYPNGKSSWLMAHFGLRNNISLGGWEATTLNGKGYEGNERTKVLVECGHSSGVPGMSRAI